MENQEIVFEHPETGASTQYVYCCSDKHRDGNPGKSQWTISTPDECSSFERACSDGWLSLSCGWGLHLVSDSIQYLGYDREVGNVFIAKFDNHSANEWHGYPCNYKISNQCPPSEILQSWVQADFLKPAKMRKIVRGQRCAI